MIFQNCFGYNGRSTTEYTLTIEDPELAVSNLTLSLIDTPGFEDTDGKEQVSNETNNFWH